MDQLIERQREFQRFVGFPIDSILESDRNEMSEKYIFKMIEEAVELRREFPSSINPWSKHQKTADLNRIKEEMSDVFLFFTNLLLVWKIDFADFLDSARLVQERNFLKIKKKKMDFLNEEILSIPGHTTGIGSGNLNPKYIFIGQNPGKGITHGYRFWSNTEDGSTKVLLPSIGDKVSDCYFTNLVKSTTIENRQPSLEEVDFWIPFLQQELQILLTSNHAKLISLGSWTYDKLNGCGYVSEQVPHPATVLYGSNTKESFDKAIETALDY